MKGQNKKALKVGLLVGIPVLLIALVSLLMPKQDQNNYYQNTISQFNVRPSTFRYVVNYKGEVHKEGAVALNKGVSGNTFVSTGANIGAGDKGVDWEYPNYCLDIKGIIQSTKPFKVQLDINLGTVGINDKFTRIVVDDDKTYVDVGSMRKWLLNSKNSYLEYLGSQLVSDTNYIVLDSNKDIEFKSIIGGNMSSLGAERNYRKVFAMGSCILKALSGVDTGLSSDDKGYYLKVNDTETSKAYVKHLKAITSDIGAYYLKYIDILKENDIITAVEAKDMQNCKNTFLKNIAYINNYLNSLNTEKEYNRLTLRINGSSLKFKDSDRYENNIGVSYTINNTDYVITVSSWVKPLSENDKIEVPVQDSAVSSSKNLGVDDLTYQLVDYLGVSPLDMYTGEKDASKQVLINRLNRNYKGFGTYVKFNYYNIDLFLQQVRAKNIFSMPPTIRQLNLYRDIKSYESDAKELYGVDNNYFKYMQNSDTEGLKRLSAEIKNNNVILEYWVSGNDRELDLSKTRFIGYFGNNSITYKALTKEQLNKLGVSQIETKSDAMNIVLYFAIPKGELNKIESADVEINEDIKFRSIYTNLSASVDEVAVKRS